MKGIQLIHGWIQGSEHTLVKGCSLGSVSQTYDKAERLSDSSIIWIIIDHLLYDLVCAFDIVKRSISLKSKGVSAILRGKARAAVNQFNQPCVACKGVGEAKVYQLIRSFSLVLSLGAGMALHHALCQRRWVHLFKCFAGSPGTYDIPLRHVVSVGSRVKTSGFIWAQGPPV